MHLHKSLNKYENLVGNLRKRRELLELTQIEASSKMGYTQSWISKVESLEVKLDIDCLYEYTKMLQIPLVEILLSSGYIESEELINAGDTSKHNTIVPSANYSFDKDSALELCLIHGKNKHFTTINNMDLKSYIELDNELKELFDDASKRTEFKNRDAIAEALYRAIRKFPKANPSDLYHHIVYRTYLRDYHASNPSKSWPRAGGEAVEILLKKVYAKRFADEGIIIQLAFEKDVGQNQFLKHMGLDTKVSGKSKLDIGLYGVKDDGELVIFGGIHSKASLAERVSDDIPCSVAMMDAGFYSYLYTFDAKSFPPPQGKLINNGEFGTVSNPSDKRGYIEDHGQFSSCFSFNFRTEPSPLKTKSGRRIIVPTEMSEHDDMAERIISDWLDFKGKL